MLTTIPGFILQLLGPRFVGPVPENVVSVEKSFYLLQKLNGAGLHSFQVLIIHN